MNTLNSLSPDYTQLSIDQIEFAYDGLNKLSSMADDIICQPRATNVSGRLHRGAFMVQIFAEAMQRQAAELVDFLRDAQFPDEEHEERRRKLVVRFDLEHTDKQLDDIVDASVPRRHSKVA